MSCEDRTSKTCGGSIKGSDDGRATFAQSNTNFTEGIFQMIASEFPASSWRILTYKKSIENESARSDRCISCYFICKQFFEFGKSSSEFLCRTWRSILRVGCALQIGDCRIGCFRFGWSHSAHSLLFQDRSSSTESAHGNTEASVSGHCLVSSGKSMKYVSKRDFF